MLRAIKEKLAGWILEILIVAFSATGTFIWGLHITNAEQDLINATQQVCIDVNTKRISSLEQQIESFRKENREDHKEIISELKEIVKKSR